MSLANKQRDARIEALGEPTLRVEFDVFANGEVSMWTHFDHQSDFNVVKTQLTAVRDHLTEFLKDENMCPFHMIIPDKK